MEDYSHDLLTELIALNSHKKLIKFLKKDRKFKKKYIKNHEEYLINLGECVLSDAMEKLNNNK